MLLIIHCYCLFRPRPKVREYNKGSPVPPLTITSWTSPTILMYVISFLADNTWIITWLYRNIGGGELRVTMNAQHFFSLKCISVFLVASQQQHIYKLQKLNLKPFHTLPFTFLPSFKLGILLKSSWSWSLSLRKKTRTS